MNNSVRVLSKPEISHQNLTLYDLWSIYMYNVRPHFEYLDIMYDRDNGENVYHFIEEGVDSKENFE